MYPASQPLDPYFGRIQRASVSILLTAIVAHGLLKALFFSPFFLHRIAIPVEQATGGILSATVVASLISLVVIVGLIIVIMGSQRLSDLGFDRKGLLMGAAAFASILMAVHLFGIGAVAVTDANLELASIPTGQFVSATLDAFVGAAVGEEILYRGFLLVQVYFLLCDRSRMSKGTCLAVSIVLTQLYFGFNHLGSALRMGLTVPMIVGYLSQAALVGAMLAVLFVRTQSIVVPIVAHGLLNLPAAAIHLPVDGKLVTLIVVCLLMLVLPYVYSSEQRRFQLVWSLAADAPTNSGDGQCNSFLRDSTQH